MLIIQSKQAQSTPDQNPTNNKNSFKKVIAKSGAKKRKKAHNWIVHSRSKPGQWGPQRKCSQQNFFKTKKPTNQNVVPRGMYGVSLNLSENTCIPE